jgi:ligand-binding sensor domain-containing protein
LFAKTINTTTWIGTDNGVKILQGDSLISSPYPKMNGIKDAFDMLEDQNGFFWIASENGLYRYNKKTKVLENYNESQGLASNILQKLLVDREGNI